jgi:spoIIIJ-associated protein
MEQHPLEQYVREVLTRVGFPDAAVEADPEGRRGSIQLAELELEQRELQEVVEALNHVVARYAERTKTPAVFFDINGYRAAREKLIESLAAAAAERVRTSGKEIELPPMNSYERRLVHARVGDTEGVVSESAGLGKERRVVIRIVV